jgi:DNA modification methylase
MNRNYFLSSILCRYSFNLRSKKLAENNGSKLSDNEEFAETFQSEIREIDGSVVSFRVGEFWTSKQRQANKIHEVSYRACFKPQLPHYFISRFTNEGSTVYDPFAGRGTTSIEAALNGRRVIQNDINPISTVFTKGRLGLPELEEVEERLEEIFQIDSSEDPGIDLTMFYHQETLKELLKLRLYLGEKRAENSLDPIDDWIAMIATNRLAGHSPGFFSVYTFPPNQAISPARQIKINQNRNQIPPYRDVKTLILKKSKQMQSGLSSDEKAKLRKAAIEATFLSLPADSTFPISKGSVDLIVTSPPFLDIVNYEEDNWLRCWFNKFDTKAIGTQITMSKTAVEWQFQMSNVFNELNRVLKQNGVIAFEVGEIRNGKIKLEELVIPAAKTAGLLCKEVLINEQNFTKTSNIWGVKNNKAGTNSNRIIILQKAQSLTKQ